MQAALGLGVIHPVINSEVQSVFRVFDVVGCGGSKVDERSALVGNQITIRILGKDEFATSQRNQGTTLDDGNTARVEDLVEECSRLVHAAVPIGVFQHLDPADGIMLTGAGSIHHVGLELTDPEAPLEIKLSKHRVLDHR